MKWEKLVSKRKRYENVYHTEEGEYKGHKYIICERDRAVTSLEEKIDECTDEELNNLREECIKVQSMKIMEQVEENHGSLAEKTLSRMLTANVDPYFLFYIKVNDGGDFEGRIESQNITMAGDDFIGFDTDLYVPNRSAFDRDDVTKRDGIEEVREKVEDIIDNIENDD